jgi:two-component system, OmpR family, KDP operon response regulator KdpE
MGVSVRRPLTRVLVLTNEVELMRLARSILEPRGCAVRSNRLSWAPAANGPFDIVIVDLPTPDLDQLRQAKRAYSEAHVIALCGSYREADCIAVLDLDADYLPRPFRPRDFAARVRVAELRRFNASGRRRFYRRGPLEIDLFGRKVALEGARIALAPSEMTILTLLASRAGSVATYGRILAGLGRPDSTGARRALHGAVFCLRRRIEDNPRRPALLLTEAGVGYRLAAETEDETQRAKNEEPSS